MNDEPILRPPQEQEVFQRVWQRVMAGREGTGPIEPTPRPKSEGGWVDGDVSPDYLAALRKAIPDRSMDHDRPGSDLPTPGIDPVPPMDITARLRQQTLEALEAWQFYRHLVRRTRGTAARTLTILAADQHRLARKLATAYFLHSGVRYWPSEQLTVPVITSYWGALRHRHQGEQQTELCYRMAADDTDDPTLRDLYESLGETCRGHCRQLRALLEQSCP